jgi:chromosome segregation ATPase
MKRIYATALFSLVVTLGWSQLDSIQVESIIRDNSQRIDRLDEERGSYQIELKNVTSDLEAVSGSFSAMASAQDELRGSLDGGLKDVSSLKNSVWSHREKLNSIFSRMDSLQLMQQELLANLQSLNEVVNDSIGSVKAAVAVNEATLNSEGERIDARLSEQSKISYASYIFALLIACVVLLMLVKRLRTAQDETQNDVESKIEASRKKMQEQLVDVDQKLAEALSATSVSAEGDDHSLALKVADEITRIESNLAQMDEAVRGHKQLSRSVSRVKDNLMASGYELVEMLGKPYDVGMIAEADFTQDDNFEVGQQVVTRVARPEIRFNGLVIQTARITVSHG